MAYTITGKKCGVVRFEPLESGAVTSESITRSNKVTSNPVEKGSDINDHVISNPTKFSISGTAVGGMSAAGRLTEMQEQGDIVTYIGKARMSDLVITDLKMDNKAKNKTGFDFTISFQTVNIVGSEYVPLGGQKTMSQSDEVQSVKNDGLKTVSETMISASAYTDYVSSYNSKPAGSPGPSSRSNPAYSGTKR